MLLQKLKIEKDTRTPEQLKEQYEIEKELANRLRESSSEHRKREKIIQDVLTEGEECVF